MTRPNATGDGPADPRHEAFEEALRTWAERPPATPAAEAARRVAERLDETEDTARPAPGRGWAVLADPRPWLAAAALVLLGLGLHGLGPAPPPGPDGAAPSLHLAATPDDIAQSSDVVQIALDDTTTLYLHLAPPSAPPGDPS